MRCNNCGWENPDGQITCEKCHTKLSGVVHAPKSSESVASRLNSTISEAVVFSDQSSGVVPPTCPKCGYPVSEGSNTCPNCNIELQQPATMKQTSKCKSCGADLASGANFCAKCGTPVSEATPKPRIQRSAMGTVMGGPVSGPSSLNKFCTLKPIAWEGEDVNYNPMTYSGDSIILNRANTDANNNSITSREQAILTCEDGEWYIENRSDLRTTFIRVNGKIKLTSGDIIVLGNREFEFKG